MSHAPSFVLSCVPPRRTSLPGPPLATSLPVRPPYIMSSPPPPSIVPSPPSPLSLSWSPLPAISSLPPSPQITLLAPPPTSLSGLVVPARLPLLHPWVKAGADPEESRATPPQAQREGLSVSLVPSLSRLHYAPSYRPRGGER